MNDLSGQTMKGYELRERIGTGGFGAVYRATQTTVGREVAIKVILPGFANQPDFVRRFEAEAQIIARLEHLHIVPLYDYWRDPNGAYLVMRWLRGGSLREALARSGPYDLETAALLLDQIAEALDVAHRHGIIHRDLKPGNILLDEDGNAYLADFGIAKDLIDGHGATQANEILGSPDYLAPEQARSEPVTARTDLYSLGVVLYEMLAGAPPFPNLSLVEMLYKHLNEPLPPIGGLPPDAKDAVNAVIARATAKNPQLRYADAPALAAAFHRAAALNRSETQASVVEVLTAREQEILRAVIEGRSNKQIAAQLFVTVATVKWYITQIYRKLGVRSRVQAIVRARELNLIASATAEGEATIIPTEQFRPDNPYKGLRPFESTDALDFFGREKLVTQLTKRLGEKEEFARFLAVIGPSGSGKSSVVKAGLIPALWRGDLPGSEKWYVVEMMPGARPLDELEVALTRLATQSTADLREQLSRDAFGLLRAVNLVLPNDGSEVVLVIDQFEEVFTLVEDERARLHFLQMLRATVIEPRSRVRVIITLRADFYDRPLRYPEFGEMLRSRMETVLPLGAKELENAVVAPAERVGVTFEDRLVAGIVDEILYQPGALPLLQYALTELFEARQGRVLTSAAYQQLGGSIGALALRAEQLYGEFPTDAQTAAHQMFLRLVTLGEGVEDTRRRVPRSELLALSDDADLIDELIDLYTDYRLLSLDRDPVTRSPTVELAHEAILREWKRLRGWLDESRSEIRLQRQLAQAVREWEDGGQDVSFLLRGARLTPFEHWVETTSLALTPKERDYLQASHDHRAQEAAAEQERQAREVRLERRSQTFLRGLVVVLLLATLGAFALTSVAVTQANVASRNADLSGSLALASAAQAALGESHTDQAIALAVAANRIDAPPAFAQTELYNAAYAPGTLRRLPCGTAWCWGFSLSPDERTVLTGDGNGGLVLSDLATGAIIRRYLGGHNEEANAMFMPDGQHFLSAGYDDKMLLWDVDSGKFLRTYQGTDGDLNSIAVSPDGRLAANGTEAGVVLVWDIESGKLLHRLVGHGDGQVQGVAFSPDGKTLLSGGEDRTMILWDVATGALIRRFEGHTNVVFSVHFSPDGQQALSTSFDNTMILWDVATGQPLRHFVGHSNWVFQARFSPDGQQIISASRDQSLIRWDVTTGRPLYTYVGEAGMALNVDYLAGGTQAVSSHNDGILRVWQLDAQNVVRQFGAPTAAVPETDNTFADGDILALSRNGRYVAAAGAGVEAHNVQLWDTDTGALVQRFTGHTDNVTAIAFSPDERQLISASWDKTLILWDAESGKEIRRFSGHSLAVFDVAFSPDGRQLVSASEDGTFVLWDVETATIVHRFGGFSDAVNSVTFSPDGKSILAGFGTIRYVNGPNKDNHIGLFDIAASKEIRRFEGHSAPVTMVSFSPDGKTILSSSTDTTVRLWDAATGGELRRLIGHATAAWSASYSADGRYAISGGQDGKTIIWDLTTGEALRTLDGGGMMAQGTAFMPNGDLGITASTDGTVRLWQLSLKLTDLLAWTQANRYVRPLACSERELYRVLPSCGADATDEPGA